MNQVPWKAIAAVVGSIALVVVAFRAPVGSASSGRSPAGVASAADGAAVLQVGPGVTSPPEPQPPADIPAPQPGQKPTQLVVVSVDGGCETPDGTIQKFLDVGKPANARYTFFLSGLCLLPDAKRTLYHPPGKAPGVSDIPFADPEMVGRRVQMFGDMYRSGHEIGTHFLGHFCDSGGVDSWSTAQWTQEIEESKRLLDTWAQNNPQAAGTPQLPFDSSVFKGDRTPCLLGKRPQMIPAFEAAGFTYEASDPGVLQWPRKLAGSSLWQFPLPALKLAGTDKWVLSMDYNLLVNQNDGRTEADPATCQRVEQQTYDTFMNALDAVYNGNRAPLILGSHLNDWLCDAYINSLERFIADVPSRHPDVKLVSFQDLAGWLDAMDPATLAQLQQLPPQRY